jgi:ParB family chromosome partitioning protein
MTSAANIIPLSRSLDIPFNKLVLSQANVRQINAGVSLDDLREDIAVRGLLQSLNVRPVLDEEGTETGTYEVPAGGRRFRALEQLVKSKRLPKTAPIPCVIKGSSCATSQEDDSLAENTHRVALHPLDQYRAFLALRRQNMSEEDIAARYFVSVSVVKQRLRLAAVSPKLLDLYGKDEMTLEQLMAFSVTGDHPRQEQVWDTIAGLQNWQKGPREIRGMLIDAAVPATDRRAVFVGLPAYEAAHGVVLRDLFSADNGGWLQDAGLLDRLVGEKLAIEAETLKPEGWKWIEVMPSVPYDHLHGLRQLSPIGPDLSEEDRAAVDALKAEYGEIEDAFADFEELPDAADQRLGELETAIEALEGTASPTFDSEDVTRGGVVISISRDGQPLIMRGYVRPEDEPTEDEDVGAEVETGEGEGAQAQRETVIISLGAVPQTVASSGEEEEADTIRPLPEKLILELTAFRTIALRDAVARNPRVAMTMLLHKLVSDTFQHRYGGSCLQVFVSPPQMHAFAPKGLNETVAAESMAHRRELWGDILPADDQALWDWLDSESDHVREELLAFCVSFGVNAVMERPNPFGAGPSQHTIDARLKQAMRVAEATDLDLVAIGWRPTADSYLNRVPRPRIIEAVREGCGERAAQLISHLKKGDMVVEAERLLAEAGWLPEALRRADEGVSPESGAAEALPAFLDDDLATDGNGPSPIAAE